MGAPGLLGPGFLGAAARYADQACGGLVPGAAMFAAAHFPPAWVVVPTTEDAHRWARGLRFFRPDRPVLLYPDDDHRPFSGVSPAPDLAAQRLIALDRPDALIVAPASALLLRVPVARHARVIQVGDQLDPTELLRWLCAVGYLNTPNVEAPGCVTLRGGVLDVWPSGAERPARVEFFDEEVERLLLLDPEARRRPSPTPAVRLLPLREARLTPQTAERAAAWIHAVAEERGVVHPERRRILQDLRAGIWFSGAEDYVPALEELAPVPLPARLYCYEPERIQAALEASEADRLRRFRTLDPEDQPLVRPFDRYLPATALDLTHGRPLTATVRHGSVDFQTRSNANLRVGAHDLTPLIQALRQLSPDHAITLVADTPTRAERVAALLGPHLRAQSLTLDAKPAKVGSISLQVGDLPDGFQADGLVFITTAELFGDRLGDPPTANAIQTFRKAAMAQLSAFERDRPVVHSRHGIGLFRGLARMPLGEAEGDFVVVEYRDGEKLYVPVHRLDQLTSFRSGEERPTLDRLGGQSWDLRKAKVKDAILEEAARLLQLHGRHAATPALPMGGVGTMFRQFEATFPYVETPDQETAIREVLDDLEGDRPMDRLLVGDVGFGKTEVAMRAIFRVVEAGYQALLLCPTTVLAFQHYNNFCKRFEGFPINIGMLSRFQKPAEARAVRAGVGSGGVDVLIATTQALGREVRFKRPGLVVVDEEHRFGVRQKEELKRIATGAHYLAMSATPIPRTLQMALSGVRALSVIATPPLGRKPIRTEVCKPTREQVTEDIRRELSRGGQVFFVHNRIQSLPGIVRWLQKLVPEARIDVAHGQMEDQELEGALIRFTRQQTDVLVCTTIIENGIDLPLVNTMLINRAEQFGVAQLYQLRGRIGRGDVEARCTLLVGKRSRLALERLAALQEHTALGSGFALASHDLELRGTGDLLGHRQHGHISSIGLDTYLDLLEQAVAEARGEQRQEQLQSEIEMPISGFLPEDYIADLSTRLDIYQRLARAGTEADVDRVMGGLEQRWGTLPEPVANLGELTRLRARCQALGIERLSWLKVRLLLQIHPRTSLSPVKVLDLCQRDPARFRLRDPQTLEVRIRPDETAAPFRLLSWVFDRLRAS